MKILVAEDDPTGALLLQRILENRNDQVFVAKDGQEALSILNTETVEAIITDWMMPNMGGIELIQEVRRRITPPPAIIVITSFNIPSAREYAMDSGADEFITKPYHPQQVFEALENCIGRKNLPQPQLPEIKTEILPKQVPFIAVGITATTGGPVALCKMFKDIQQSENVVYFVVLQVPMWALDLFAMRLQRQTGLKVRDAKDGEAVETGCIYIAPRDRHLTLVDDGTYTMHLTHDAPQNFCRPSADVLFESLAQTFHKYAVGVTLTGTGRDGAIGCAHIVGRQGTIFVQDPKSAEASAVPQTVVDLGIPHHLYPLDEMGHSIDAFLAQKIKALSNTSTSSFTSQSA